MYLLTSNDIIMAITKSSTVKHSNFKRYCSAETDFG